MAAFFYHINIIMIATNLQPLGIFKIQFSNELYKDIPQFVVSVDLPSSNCAQVPVSWKGQKGFLPSETVTYDSLNIRVALNTAGDIYIKLFGWLHSYSKGIKGAETDMTFMFIDTKNKPTTQILFTNVFPMTLGSSQFNVQNQDVEYAFCDVTLSYDKIKIL